MACTGVLTVYMLLFFFIFAFVVNASLRLKAKLFFVCDMTSKSNLLIHVKII